MKTNTSWKGRVIVVALGIALLGVPICPAVSKPIAADPMTLSDSSGRPANVTEQSVQASDSVAESNQNAVEQTLLSESAVAPVNQVLEWNQIFIDTLIATNTANSSSPRLVAIVHTAIFDAFNGIKRRYTPIFVQNKGPKGASRPAAVIAAAIQRWSACSHPGSRHWMPAMRLRSRR